MKLRSALTCLCVASIALALAIESAGQSTALGNRLTNTKVGPLKSGERLATLTITTPAPPKSVSYQLYAKFSAPGRTAITVDMDIEVQIPGCKPRGQLAKALVAQASFTGKPDGSGVVVKSIALKGNDITVNLTVNGAPNPHVFSDAVTQAGSMQCR